MPAIGTRKLSAIHRPDGRGLAWNVGLAVLAVLLINGLIGLLNPREMSSSMHSPLTPPGYVIGIVWIGLFICLGVARWHLLKTNSLHGPSTAPIVVLAVLCLAYPVYTGGLRNETVGLIGNVATLVVTLGVIASVLPQSPAAALWTAPIAVWLTYAAFLTALSAGSR